MSRTKSGVKVFCNINRDGLEGASPLNQIEMTYKNERVVYIDFVHNTVVTSHGIEHVNEHFMKKNDWARIRVFKEVF